MDLISWNGVFAAFKFICIISAVSMTIYCCYDYSQNEDLSIVSFREFSQNDDSIYPQLNLCVSDYTAEAEVVTNLVINFNQAYLVEFIREKSGTT